MAFLLSFAAFAIVLVATELLHRRFGVSSEDTRRIAHMGSAVVASALPIVLGWNGIVVLGLAFAVVLAISRRRRVLRSVHSVARRTWGEVCYPAGVALLAAAHPPVALYVFGTLVMGLSDGMAGLVGQHRGRHPYHLGAAHKTVEGSIAFFGTTLVLGSVVPVLGDADATPLSVAAVVAALLTAIESALPWGLDNLVLPGAAALILWGLDGYALSVSP